MRAPAGRVLRAIAPYAPRLPLRVYAEAGPPVEVRDPSALIRGGHEVTLLQSVKPRPVLVVTEPVLPFNEVLALRLSRFSKLTEAEQATVRNGEHPDLFHLRPDSCPALDEECAAIISSMLRLPLEIVGTDEELGCINENEMRVIHERLARLYKLDLRQMVMGKAKRLVAELQARANP